jgi:hypothetical protein
LSEPPGAFAHSDNLVSNEHLFAHRVRLLQGAGGVYIGVGPEQNFSYIARLQPAMAFIVDIRQENRNLHLMYKALFEMSADRADFVFRLFSRERPADAGHATTVQELFQQLAAAKPSGAHHDETARLVRQRLLAGHRFPLTPQDLDWIEFLLETFYVEGPEIHYYGRSHPTGPVAAPSYRALMTATDVMHVSRSYLATEEAFAYVRDLQSRNLIVPVVGDFGGRTTFRNIGDYIRERGAVVTAFYGSNVEVYLDKPRTAAYCGSLADLPASLRAQFIDAKGVRSLRSKIGTCAPRRGVFER